MQGRIWFAVLTLGLVACRKDDYAADVAQETKVSAKSPLEELAESTEILGVEYGAARYEQLPRTADRAATVAKRIGPIMVAKWEEFATRARTHASAAGTRRARGTDDSSMMKSAPAMLDELAPLVPGVTSKWATLKAELAALEQKAFDAEKADTRPNVIVWTDIPDKPTKEQLFASVVITCVHDAMEKRWPAIKFVEAYKRPASGSHVELVALTATDTYRSSTGEEVRVASGGGIRILPTQLPAAMAKVFAQPIVATAHSSNPDQIKSDLGVTPTLETTRVGMAAISTIREGICADVALQISRP
ncbi:MAG: hypothetical protein H0T42_09355 [Deltaproteobacteria bacterium]|nr:hypothetical protein [Deltaproteobacteria bacterium]